LPTIYFSPLLKETLFEFSRYVYDADKQKPKDEHDHMMENLYRLVLNGLSYVKPAMAEDYKPLEPVAIRFDEDLLDMPIVSYHE
jgi:hypothetical protein